MLFSSIAIVSTFVLAIVNGQTWDYYQDEKSSGSVSNSANAIPFEAVATMDLNAYNGRWYQVMTNAFMYTKMEPMQKCITFDHYPGPNRKVDIVKGANYMLLPDVCVKTWLEAEPLPQPSKWKLPLFGGQLETWILKLGPKVNNMYEYSVVSDSSGMGLMVLARDVNTFSARYEQEVRKHIELAGFTQWWKRAFSVEHPKDCQYSPLPPAPVSPLAIDNLMGRWFPVMDNLYVQSLTPRGKCHVLDMKRTDSKVIQNVLSAQIGSDKSLRQSIAYSFTIPDVEKPAELLFAPEHMDPMQNLVVAVGPVVQGKYEYAIFSDPLRLTL
eukprot:Pgem_evm1s4309